MFGPKGLGTIRNLDGFEGLFAGVGGSEGDVLRRVPVLGENDVIESLRKRIDKGSDLIAFGYGERSARAEVVLEIDDEESVGLAKILKENSPADATVQLTGLERTHPLFSAVVKVVDHVQSEAKYVPRLPRLICELVSPLPHAFANILPLGKPASPAFRRVCRIQTVYIFLSRMGYGEYTAVLWNYGIMETGLSLLLFLWYMNYDPSLCSMD